MTRITVLSGSGLSAAAGLSTFRGAGGLWRRLDPMALATPEAWEADPRLVTEFYNERRAKAWQAHPTRAHRAIARLDDGFSTTVITQNVDDLHERAGSRRVLHLHGRIDRVRSTYNPELKRSLRGNPVEPDEQAPDGGAWRPDVVWFGEPIQHFDQARAAVATAERILVVGTSLTVQPAASLLHEASDSAEKIIVNPEITDSPEGYRLIQSPADEAVPELVERWLSDR